MTSIRISAVRNRRSTIYLLFTLLALAAAPALATDGDGDGIEDTADNCIAVPNDSQCDTDADGYGNICDGDFDNDFFTFASDFDVWYGDFSTTSLDSGTGTDLDCDGYVLTSDYDVLLPMFQSGAAPGPSGLSCAGTSACVDSDHDGVPDGEDNCQTAWNPGQLDEDGDGFGSVCDGDFDNDGMTTPADQAIFQCAISGALQVPATDLDGDGFTFGSDYDLFLTLRDRPPGPSGGETQPFVPNDSLDDPDGDGLPNYLDNCTMVPSSDLSSGTAVPDPIKSWDEDGDGFGRICDADYDEDGDVDADDLAAFLSVFTVGGYDPEMDHDGDEWIGTNDYDIAWALIDAGTLGPSGTPCPPIPATPSALPSLHQVLRGGEIVGQLTTGAGNQSYTVASGPDCGSIPNCLTVSPTGVFRFVSDGSSTLDSTSFTYYATNLATEEDSQPATVTLELVGAAESEFASNDLSPHALVIYNQNADGAAEIAEYYRASRGLASNQLCPVQMPNGLYASMDELLGARKAILDDCICPLIPMAQRPANCGVDDPAAVAAVSPITHLVMIRGMPGRLFNTGLLGDGGWEPSLDPVLAFLLYHDEQELPSHLSLDSFVPFLSSAAGIDTDGDSPSIHQVRYLRGLRAGYDRFASYGRIEAMDVVRTKALIDRTLDAERAGFRGNIVTETPRDFDYLRDRTASHAAECTAYVDDDLETWPYAECRTGTTYSDASPAVVNKSAVPGEGGSEIPLAVNVGLMIGSNYVGNGHGAFDGALTNWRRSGASCQPLCANAADPQQCAEDSTDFFKELDTSCVGAAPGLIGFQLRSYPVAYYGFYPLGWGSGVTGGDEKTPPRVLTGGAAAGERYLHLGSHAVGNPDASECTRAGGVVVPCLERIPIQLGSVYVYPTAVTLRDFDLSFSYRSQTNGKLRALVLLVDSDGTAREDSSVLELTASSAWQSVGPVHIGTTGSGLDDVKSVHLGLLSGFTSTDGGFQGFVDLDDVKIVDAVTGLNVLTAAVGSFESNTPAVALGDYAAQAIDRLGAIGWWGSSSHAAYTNGFAFANTARTIRGFFAGRSLGESVVLGGSLGSGLFYGDPLYRPSAAALFFVPEARDKRFTVDNQLPPSSAPSPVGPVDALTTWFAPQSSTNGQLVTAANKEMYRDLFVNVLHGTDHLADVNWQLSTCTGPPGVPIAAEDCTSWNLEPAQTGAVKEHRIHWLDDLIDDAVDQFVVIRLKVWNTGQEDRALYDFSYLDYRANSL